MSALGTVYCSVDLVRSRSAGLCLDFCLMDGDVGRCWCYSVLPQLAARGISVTVADGDSGASSALGCNKFWPEWPASSACVQRSLVVCLVGCSLCWLVGWLAAGVRFIVVLLVLVMSTQQVRHFLRWSNYFKLLPAQHRSGSRISHRRVVHHGCVHTCIARRALPAVQ